MRTRLLRHRTGMWLAGVALVAAACGGATGSVRVVIPPGAGLGAAADSLERAGVIGYPRLFRLYATVTNRDRRLKPGTYLLRREASWNEVLTSLVEGHGIVHAVTIPEGWQIANMLPMLEQKVKVPKGLLLVAVRDSAVRERLDREPGVSIIDTHTEIY